METVTSEYIKQKEFTNSDKINPGGKYTKLNINGVVHEWVGIGWVECPKDMPKDFPELVSDYPCKTTGDCPYEGADFTDCDDYCQR